MDENTNPDSVALDYLKEILLGFEVEFPDGGHSTIKQVDEGFQSTPTHNPYVSLTVAGSRAPIRRLGQGAGALARDFEIDLMIVVVYEDTDPQQGSRRLSHLRWEVFRMLASHARKVPGVELLDFEEASLLSFQNDDGGVVDWGYVGQIIIPCTVILRGNQ